MSSATTKSQGLAPDSGTCQIIGKDGPSPRSWNYGAEPSPALFLSRRWFWLLGPLFLTGALARAAEPEPSAEASQAFWRAQAQYTNQPQSVPAAWKFGRACFDLAELASNTTQRAAIATQGVVACRGALGINSNCAPAHYYLGLNLGELARSKGLGALRLVNEMERELVAAARLDAGFDFGGPDRSLGMLYRDTPALISIGSRSKARQHLQRAIRLAPDFPENRLELIESEVKWHERANAQHEMTALEEIWPRARTQFAGPAWTGSWNDWTGRLRKLKLSLQEAAKFEEFQR